MVSKKEDNKKIDEEIKSLFNIFKYPIILNYVDEILEREVVAIGNGAHINIPLKHLGKKVQITILKQEKNILR